MGANAHDGCARVAAKFMGAGVARCACVCHTHWLADLYECHMWPGLYPCVASKAVVSHLSRMATNSRLGDMMIARGFHVAALGHDRFPVILDFLNEQEICSMDDFEGMVLCRGCVRVLPPTFLSVVPGLPPFDKMSGRHVLDPEEIRALQEFADWKSCVVKRARIEPVVVVAEQCQVAAVEEMLDLSPASDYVDISKLGPRMAGRVILRSFQGSEKQRRGALSFMCMRLRCPLPSC